MDRTSVASAAYSYSHFGTHVSTRILAYFFTNWQSKIAPSYQYFGPGNFSPLLPSQALPFHLLATSTSIPFPSPQPHPLSYCLPHCCLTSFNLCRTPYLETLIEFVVPPNIYPNRRIHESQHQILTGGKAILYRDTFLSQGFSQRTYVYYPRKVY